MRKECEPKLLKFQEDSRLRHSSTPRGDDQMESCSVQQPPQREGEEESGVAERSRERERMQEKERRKRERVPECHNTRVPESTRKRKYQRKREK